MPRTAQISVLISTLGKMAFQLAGQIADGAISWVCPVPYLLDTGIPAFALVSVSGLDDQPPLLPRTCSTK